MDQKTAKLSNETHRPSASIIVAAQIESTTDLYDYKVLVFKRTQRTAFAVDHCVFPGGVLEITADESNEWLEYFKEFDIPQSYLETLHIDATCRALGGHDRTTKFLTCGQNFTRDISLRITAIRETFEEVGILLCRTKEAIFDQSVYGQYREDFNRKHWQHLVHNDAREFLKLCRHLQVVPDLWCLHEWSVWRAPMSSTKRFDTVFYFVALQKQPNLLLEPSEVDFAMWHSPTIYLKKFSLHHIWLPPVQFYELSRLTHTHKWSELLQFAQQRGQLGSTILMPVYYCCTDGLVGILPGDDLYPKEPNSYRETVVEASSIAKFQEKSQNLHRFMIYNMYDIQVVINIKPLDEHLSPLTKQPITNYKLSVGGDSKL